MVGRDEEVPTFVFQYNDNPDEFIDDILSLSSIYHLRKEQDGTLSLIQENKTLPYYGNRTIIHSGDYLVPILLVQGNVIFGTMNEKQFEEKYIAGRT